MLRQCHLTDDRSLLAQSRQDQVLHQLLEPVLWPFSCSFLLQSQKRSVCQSHTTHNIAAACNASSNCFISSLRTYTSNTTCLLVLESTCYYHHIHFYDGYRLAQMHQTAVSTFINHPKRSLFHHSCCNNTNKNNGFEYQLSFIIASFTGTGWMLKAYWQFDMQKKY